MRLLWLPDVLRAAGLRVNAYLGWETRGSTKWGPLRGIICHATASSRSSTPSGDMRVLWETGSATAPVPISQLYLARDGTWWVGASGLCYHALVGTKGPHKGYGNTSLIGVEAANDNLGEPWPAVQLDAYQRGVAAICRHMGWSPDVAVAHRDHQDGKSDPYGVDMTDFRRRVSVVLAGQSTSEERMFTIVRKTSDKTLWLCDTMTARRITDAELADLRYIAKQGAVQLWNGGQVWEGLVPAWGLPIDASGQPVQVDYDRIEDIARDAVADGLEGGAAKVRAE